MTITSMLSKNQNWPHYSAEEVTSDDRVCTSQKKIVPVPSLMPGSPSVQQYLKFSRVMGHSGWPFRFCRESHCTKTWHWDRLGIAGKPLCISRLFMIRQIRRLNSQYFSRVRRRRWQSLIPFAIFRKKVLPPPIPVIKNSVGLTFFLWES